MPLGYPLFLHHLLPEPGVGVSNRVPVHGMSQMRLCWWLALIAEMQSADSGNQFNFCCSVTRGRGRKVRAVLKATVQLKKQNTPPKESEIIFQRGKIEVG